MTRFHCHAADVENVCRRDGHILLVDAYPSMGFNVRTVEAIVSKFMGVVLVAVM